MRAASMIAVLPALIACRQILGVPGEGEVSGFPVSVDVRGALGASTATMVLFVDGVAVSQIPVTADGIVMFDVGVPENGNFEVVVESTCSVRNGTGTVVTGDIDVVDVTCDGLSSLASLGISSPIDLVPAYAPSTQTYTARASLLTQSTWLVPARSYDSATIGDVALDSIDVASTASGYGPVALAGALGLRVEANHADVAPHAYNLTIDTTTPAAYGYGKPDPSPGGALFGAAVAVDRDVLVVGAPEHPGGGRAYVFRRSGQAWTQEAVLAAPAAAQGDRFGAGVAVAGDRIVVGAPGIAGALDITGAAHVFRRSGAAWVDDRTLVPALAELGDEVGTAVAFAGVERTTVVVGAPGDDSGSSSPGDNSAPRAGAVYVFDPDGVEIGYLKATPIQAGDELGTSVAAAASLIVAGSPRNDVGSGSAHVFSSGAWESRLAIGIGSDRFGRAVAVTASGPRIVVGAPQSGTGGTAYVFDGPSWSSMTTLSVAASAAGDNVGAAVAIAGGVVAVGAFGTDNQTGAVHVFEIGGAPTPITLAAPSGQQFDVFGTAVALAIDQLIVGAAREDSSTRGWNSTPDEMAPESGAVYSFR